MLYRIRDVFLAMVMIILLFPLVAVISMIVLLVYGRPVFYSERRVGLNGTSFTLYKFRTLIVATDCGKTVNDLENRILKNGTPENCPGDFLKSLRKYSLDELPQIWNVLTGSMSIVGPRPMPADELRYRFGREAPKVISVRPGLTGLWQVSGRNDLSPEERRRLDLYYIETRNGLSDLKIILKTFYAVVSGRGAY